MTDSSVPIFWDKYIVKTSVYKLRPSIYRWCVIYAASYIGCQIDIILNSHNCNMLSFSNCEG